MLVRGEVGAVAIGTVVRFSAVNGYGFITPDDGGEDVFLHASLLSEEFKNSLAVGARVEFQAVPSDRGPKAVGVNVVDAALSPGARERQAERRAALPAGDDDDQLCDVIPASVFAQRITEVLIEVAPEVTGAQISQVRQRLLAFGRRHGWVED
jgi:cold shock CspA family protein